jgi:type VI protein secretion system component VasK
MNGQLITSSILGAIALVFIAWAVVERARLGRYSAGARIRLRVALIFVLVAVWLTWWRQQGV